MSPNIEFDPVKGTWTLFVDGHGFAAVRRKGNVFYAAVGTRTVLGEYPTVETAVAAAELMAMNTGDTLCTPRDIDRVRKELRR